MINYIYTLLFVLIVSFANAQWTYRNIDNGFDEPYKIAHSAVNNNGFVKLEEDEGTIFFYLQGTYFCDEYPDVDLVYVVNGQNKKYNIQGFKTSNSTIIVLSFDLLNDEMLNDFKNCTTLKIRVNETHCRTDVYTFNMSKSSSALNFVKGK
jgi:hypothetical protein